MLLIGRAQVEYCSIMRLDTQDYYKIKNEILLRLDITPERQQQFFYMKKKKEDRSPRVLWQHLTDLIEKWLKSATAVKEEICD